MQKQTVVYDIETLSNLFTYVAINPQSKAQYKFVIWDKENQFIDFIKHLANCKGMIGFNNLNFDYPVLHYLIENREQFAHLSGKQLAKKIYKKAQETIEREYSAIKDEEVIIPQLDLFRIWHYDNKARMTSLKKLEIALNFPNVQDMPYHHTYEVTTSQEVEDILNYNINDVEATDMFYEKTKDKIELRKGLLSKYGLQCLNYPDSKIGEQLMLKLYCKFTGEKEELVKRKRSHRSIFNFADCVPDYINYHTPDFNQLFDYIKSIQVRELKNSFKYSFDFGGFTFDLGTGGIHGCIKPGVYETDDEYIVVDADVASLYPSLAITNNLYPEHLGEEFSKIYEDGIVKPRLEAKKNKDMVMADGFKLSANSVYGKSNSEYSFLYDPLYTLKTTLAGQLALCMLSEMIMTRVPDITMLQINTDGLTVRMPIKHKRLYWDICREWEAISGLVLEYVAYSKMIIRDVNNYIAVSMNGKVKYKGAFKPNHEMYKDGEYHKSFSQGIVPLAVSDYFLKNIPVEETIKNNTNIYDFCKTFNASHGWVCETVLPDGTEQKKEQKTNRYYLSRSGKIFRKLKDDRVIEVESNKLVTIFNTYIDKPMVDYDIDYDYYVDECYKIIWKIDGTEERMLEEKLREREQLKREKEENDYKKFCIDKIPTELQFEKYSKEWLLEKYGYPKEIKPSKRKTVQD